MEGRQLRWKFLKITEDMTNMDIIYRWGSFAEADKVTDAMIADVFGNLGLSGMEFKREDRLPAVEAFKLDGYMTPKLALSIGRKLEALFGVKLKFLELSGQSVMFVAAFPMCPTELLDAYGYPLDDIAKAWAE